MSFDDIKTAIMENKIKAVKDLIKAHPTIVNIENDARETPLYMASYLGHLDIVELLVESGARIDHKDTRGGWTALMLACNQGHMHIVEYLIIEGAKLNEKNKHYGSTALMLACGKNNGHNFLHIIALLLNEGADLSIEDNEGRNAMNYAEGNGDPFVIQLLTNIEDARANRFTLEIVPLNKSRIPATAEDVINAEDINIEDFLAESTQNKIIKHANSFYTLNTKDIKKHYLRKKYNNNYIYYPCRQTWPSRLIINKEDVYFDKPLFSTSYIVGLLSDFLLLNEVKAMIESTNQYFEIITSGSEVEDIIATASGQMFSIHANAASANHCQPGKEAKIFKLKMLNIVEDAVEASIVKSLSKALEEEGKEEEKEEGKGKKTKRKAKKGKKGKKGKKSKKSKKAKKRN